ncbi:translocation protein [Pluteus cervinus]|uniref:Translocation protein n=1 Tax=Pluteus cervinus TaxID=181527 RepID=A0ACD3B3E1_9AGAR|nr:translocation protein [Pluteus cervinus]
MQRQMQAPLEIKKVAQFLRSGSAGLKIHAGAINGKRFPYFKGKSAMNALLSPAYNKLEGVPKVTSEDDAIRVLTQVHNFVFYLRVDRGGPSSSSSSSPKKLQVTNEQFFKADQYYVWFYEGSQRLAHALGISMATIILTGVMYPLWPPIMKSGALYLSCGVLALFGLVVLRLIFYCITVVVASPGIWLFPGLLANVGSVDMFTPLWAWDIPQKKTKRRRRNKKEGTNAGDGLAPKNHEPVSSSSTLQADRKVDDS